MSDKPPRNDDDYDTLFPDSGKSINADEIISFSDDKKDFDARDYDDEDGIFAPDEPYQKTAKKSSGVLGAVLLVGVLAAGGYVVYSNPSLINQIKSNFNVTDTASVPIPAELNVAATLPTVSNPVAPLSQESETLVEMPLPDTVGDANAVVPPAAHPVDTPPVPPAAATDSPPADIVSVPAETQPVIPSADSAIADYAMDQSVTSSSSPDASIPPVSGAVDTPPASEPVSGTVPESLPPEPSVPAAADTLAVAQPSSEQTAPEKTGTATTETAVTTEPESPAVTAVATPAPDIKSEAKPEIKPDATAEVEKADAPKIDAVKTEAAVEPPKETAAKTEESAPPVIKRADVFQSGAKPVVVQSEDEKQAIANAKVNTYFDAPKGKVLNDIPAPSLNTKRGKNESIIVVTKQAPKKPSSSSASNQKSTRNAYQYDAPTPRVNVETNSLKGQVTAASRALKLGRYDAAQTMYDELYRLNPRDGEVLMGRAVLFQKTGQTERAISAYEEVLRLDPNNAEALVNVAGLVRKQYPAVALSKLLDLHQQYPSNPYVTAQLGVTYADTGNVQDAYRYLSQAASQEPNNPKHYFNMAVVADRAGNTTRAVQYYERALEVDAMYSDGRGISREKIYDRLSMLRGQ